MTLQQLNDRIDDFEATLAEGNETPLLGHYRERMRQIARQCGTCARDSGSVTVPDNEVAWWIRAYELYKADLAKPSTEQAASIQDIFDAV